MRDGGPLLAAARAGALGEVCGRLRRQEDARLHQGCVLLVAGSGECLRAVLCWALLLCKRSRAGLILPDQPPCPSPSVGQSSSPSPPSSPTRPSRCSRARSTRRTGRRRRWGRSAGVRGECGGRRRPVCSARPAAQLLLEAAPLTRGSAPGLSGASHCAGLLPPHAHAVQGAGGDSPL